MLELEPTLGEQLARAARSRRGVRFLDTSEQPTFLEYSELHARALGTAGALLAMRLAPGERVGLVLPTGPSFYDAFFGAQLAGLVPVPLYPPLRLGRLEEYHERTAAMLRACDARLVLTNRRIRRLLGHSMERAGLTRACVAMRELVPRAPALARPRPDDLAFIQFSSGTTQAPKPVALTHRQVQANVRVVLEHILAEYPEGPELTHACVSWLPLYHDMGLVGCVLTAMARPGDLTLLPPELFAARPASWLRAISRYAATISAAPNFAYALCAARVRDDELAGVDLSRWRVALDGAEPVTAPVLERFTARFAAWGLHEEVLTPVYGLAEATLAVSFSDMRRRFVCTRFERAGLTGAGTARPADDGVPLVGLGRPLPGFALRIAGEHDEELRPGELGRVLVRGPSVMSGYFAQPRLTASALRGGWLDTGDTGFVHDGELYLYGRAKDIVVVRGRKYAPQEIEQALDGVADARRGCSAAVGVVTDEADGEALYVFVERSRTATRGDEELAAQVTRAVAERTGLVADRVVVLAPGTLPRTSSGKISRSETRRRYLAGTLAPPRPVGALQLARELLRSRISFMRGQGDA